MGILMVEKYEREYEDAISNYYRYQRAYEEAQKHADMLKSTAESEKRRADEAERLINDFRQKTAKEVEKP